MGAIEADQVESRRSCTVLAAFDRNHRRRFRMPFSGPWRGHSTGSLVNGADRHRRGGERATPWVKIRFGPLNPPEIGKLDAGESHPFSFILPAILAIDGISASSQEGAASDEGG